MSDVSSNNCTHAVREVNKETNYWQGSVSQACFHNWISLVFFSIKPIIYFLTIFSILTNENEKK